MGWFPSPSPDKPDKLPLPTQFAWMSDYLSLTPGSQETLNQLQQQEWTPLQKTLVGITCAASFGIGFKSGRIRPAWKRWTAVSDIPSSNVGATAPWMRGRVVSVSDGDTIRFLHVPTLFHSSHLQEGEKMSTTALAVRVCTIDTPETAKFGKPGQAFGDEAKEKLTAMIKDKKVSIQILQTDQYGRAVAQVRSGPSWWASYMDEVMLKAGLAEVYRGGGAVYGRLGKDKYISMEETAQGKKKGMWSQKNRESAAEFKARMKAEA